MDSLHPGAAEIDAEVYAGIKAPRPWPHGDKSGLNPDSVRQMQVGRSAPARKQPACVDATQSKSPAPMLLTSFGGS